MRDVAGVETGSAGRGCRLRALFVVVPALFVVMSAGALGARSRPSGNFVRVASVAHLLVGGAGVAVSGSVRCVKGDHVRVSVWVLERSRGALAKGSTPIGASAAASAGVKPSPIVCLGVRQRWSITAGSTGKRPPGFAPGTAQVCATMIASRKYVYTDLEQTCVKAAVR